MPGNQDHSGRVPVRWSDGRFLYRRTWPETVSTLTRDPLGDCPVEARIKPVAGEAAGSDALIGSRQTLEPQPPHVPVDAQRMAVQQLISRPPATQAESLPAAPNPQQRT